MDRPNLQGRVPDTITTRLPGRESEETGDATDGPSDDEGYRADDGSTSRRATTLLTLAGLGLATLGVVLRYVLDSRGGADDEPDPEPPAFDAEATGSVEIVGEERDRADASAHDARLDEADSDTVDASDIETDTSDAEADASDAETDTSDAEADASDAETVAPTAADATETDAEPGEESSAAATARADVRVDTFGADRIDSADGESGDDEPDDDREGPPRIAPLVGLAGLVGMRLFVERMRKKRADAADRPGDQL